MPTLVELTAMPDADKALFRDVIEAVGGDVTARALASTALTAASSFRPFAPRAETALAVSYMTTKPSAAHLKRLDWMMRRLIAAGIYDALRTTPKSGLYITIGVAEDQILVNLLSPGRNDLTKVGAPTFTPYGGVSHTVAGDNYDTGIALADLSGYPLNMGGMSLNTPANANTIEMGAVASDNTSGLTLGFNAANGRPGVRAMSTPVTLTSNTNNWNGENTHDVNIAADGTATIGHLGQVIEQLNRTALTFTSTNTLRILGASNSAAVSNKQMAAAWFGGALTVEQRKQLSAIIMTYVADLRWGIVDTYEERVGPAEVVTDILVIGGTLAGAIAARRAKQEGRSSVLLCDAFETRIDHLPGMPGGGALGYLDTRQFTTAVSGAFRDVLSWSNLVYLGRADTDSQEGLSTTSAAYRAAFRRMFDPTRQDGTYIKGVDVPVFFSRGPVKVDVESGASTKALNTGPGFRLTTVTAADGRVFKCKQVIATDYEGSLLPLLPAHQRITGTERAGTTDMENRNGYKGTAAGFLKQIGRTSTPVRIDPFVTPGDAASGLLPLVEYVPNLVVNGPDPSSQSVNKRLPFTTRLFRAAPWDAVLPAAPAGYNELEFEVHKRWYALDPLVNADTLLKLDPVTGTSYDVNNSEVGGLSTDMPGSGTRYAAAAFADGPFSRANRLAVRIDYQRWIKSFFWYHLKSGTAGVPAALRTALLGYTLDATQFLDPDPSIGDELYWPGRIYVRDPVWRMVNQAVAPFSGTDAYATDGSPIRPAGTLGIVGSYAPDRHAPRRVAHNDGNGWAVYAQGGYYESTGMKANEICAISLSHYMPDEDRYTNLAYPTAMSATAVGWSVARMEPALCAAAEACAVAAAIAIEDGITIQAAHQGANKDKFLARAQARNVTRPLSLITTN